MTLRVDSDVPGAQVFIDRQFIGGAPVSTTEVKPGTHQINVSAPGYDQYAQSIDLSSGSRDVMVRFKEVRLDAKAEVVHKHGVGSCRGTLACSYSPHKCPCRQLPMGATVAHCSNGKWNVADQCDACAGINTP